MLLNGLLAGSALGSPSMSIHVDWGYTPPTAPPVTGYVLYQEGLKVCTFPGAGTMAADCVVTLTKESTSFTMTAAFSDNSESPHSSPYVFTTTLINKEPIQMRVIY